jgi:hypothetical protein
MQLFLALITVGAVVAAAALWCAYVITARRHPTSEVRMHKPGICLYLDHDNAMDLYLQEDKYPDLKRSVQEKIRHNTEGEVKVQSSPIGAGVKTANEREEVSQSIKEDGPITVIGRIIPALDNANDIVYVDLLKCRIGPSVGLDRALERTHGKRAKRMRQARLRELESDTFVFVEGRFWVTAKSETTTTFSAPYGDPGEFSSDLPKVSVTCDNDQLRRKVHDGDSFRARCLGKISWNPRTRQLEISPLLAIFQ